VSMIPTLGWNKSTPTYDPSLLVNESISHIKKNSIDISLE
jgi:hypothetical protein